MTYFLFPILYIILGSQQIPRLFLSLLFVLLQPERQMTVTVGSLFMSIFASLPPGRCVDAYCHFVSILEPFTLYRV